jgi:hypothetical protein
VHDSAIVAESSCLAWFSSTVLPHPRIAQCASAFDLTLTLFRTCLFGHASGPLDAAVTQGPSGARSLFGGYETEHVLASAQAVPTFCSEISMET